MRYARSGGFSFDIAYAQGVYAGNGKAEIRFSGSLLGASNMPNNKGPTSEKAIQKECDFDALDPPFIGMSAKQLGLLNENLLTENR